MTEIISGFFFKYLYNIYILQSYICRHDCLLLLRATLENVVLNYPMKYYLNENHCNNSHKSEFNLASDLFIYFFNKNDIMQH